MENFQNFKQAIEKFSIGYNKSVILDYISKNSFDIIMKNINTIKDGLESIVAVFEEIRATSQSTSQNTARISQEMNDILTSNRSLEEGLSRRVQEITDSNDKVRDMAALFQDIFEKSKEIRGITGKIQAVSKRTNVLAINASIEASKAGLHGQGFSIIANEVRNLATQTSSFAKDIEKTIAVFLQSVDKVSSYISDFTRLLEGFQVDIVTIKESFGKNTMAANQVGDAMSLISHSSEEETQALNEGLSKLENIFDITRNAFIIASSIRRTYTEIDMLLKQKA